jgi:hypothetical protein
MSNMQSMQNIQNMKNMFNMLNMSNMQNMHKNTDLVHKIVYLALCPLFLETGVAKIGSSSSSMSSAHATLGVVLGPAAAAGEGTAGRRSQSACRVVVSWQASCAWPVLRLRVDLRDNHTLLRTTKLPPHCMHCDRLRDSCAHQVTCSPSPNATSGCLAMGQ